MHLGDVDEALRLVTAGLERLDAELGPDAADAAPLGAALQPGAAAHPHRTARGRARRVRAAARRRPPPLRVLLRAGGDPPPARRPRRGDRRLHGGDPAQPALPRAALQPRRRRPRARRRRARARPPRPGARPRAGASSTPTSTRAGIRHELGDIDGAAADVARRAGRRSGHPPSCAASTGCCSSRRRAGRTRAPRSTRRSRPIASLAAAWANRAIVRYRTGDTPGAISDLDAAIALDDDPALRANRDIVLGSLAA